MARARIKISDTKGIQIEGIKISGKNYVSLRQFYKTSKSDEWLPGKQGITIEVDNVEDIIKAMEKCLTKKFRDIKE